MKITEMKRISKEAGSHTFDRDAMTFFNAVIETPPNDLNFFIESIQMDDDSPRQYKIKLFLIAKGTTVTFYELPNLATAKAWLNRFTTALKKEACYREKSIIENITWIEEASGYPKGMFKIYNGDEYILTNTNDYSRFIAG